MLFDETEINDQPVKIKEKNQRNKKLLISKKQKKDIQIKKKEKLPKVSAEAVSLLPFVDAYDTWIETKNGAMDMYQIESRDIYSLSEGEAKRVIYELTKFFRVYQFDFKLVSMSFPSNTTKQQQYIEQKIRNATNPIYLPFLNKKLEELLYLEAHRMNQEYYLILFADSEEMLNDQKKTVKRMLHLAMPVHELTKEKKQKILYKLTNQNAKIIYSS